MRRIRKKNNYDEMTGVQNIKLFPKGIFPTISDWKDSYSGGSSGEIAERILGYSWLPFAEIVILVGVINH